MRSMRTYQHEHMTPSDKYESAEFHKEISFDIVS